MYQLHSFDKTAEVMPPPSVPTDIMIYRIDDEAALFRPTTGISRANATMIVGLGLMCWGAVGTVILLFV